MAEEEGEAALAARHEREEEELEAKVQAHLEAVKASAGKGKKAKEKVDAAERECEQWKYEMHVRHEEEREALGGGGSGGGAAEAAAEEAPEPAGGSEQGPSAAELEAERARKKKEKAQKKRDGQKQKQAEREEAIEREKREAGPSRRALELASLATQLAAHKPALRCLEVPGDGHCLYRSIADQLRRFRPDLHKWKKGPEQHHEEVRAVCAGALRQRVDDYAPFAELKDGEDFEGYCKRVECSADWGGELELRALADQLRAQILVFRAGESKPLTLGPDSGGEPLRVTYHQYWYALGEHYNSVEPIEG